MKSKTFTPAWFLRARSETDRRLHSESPFALLPLGRDRRLRLRRSHVARARAERAPARGGRVARRQRRAEVARRASRPDRRRRSSNVLRPLRPRRRFETPRGWSAAALLRQSISGDAE